jgi:hypothetical protein
VQQVGANELVSPDPLTVEFTVRDTRLAMPGVTGCGPWSRAVDHRLALPSPAGRNFFEHTTYVRFRRTLLPRDHMTSS